MIAVQKKLAKGRRPDSSRGAHRERWRRSDGRWRRSDRRRWRRSPGQAHVASDGRRQRRWNLQGRKESERRAAVAERRAAVAAERRTGDGTCGAMSGTAAVGRWRRAACQCRSCFRANFLSSFTIWGEVGRKKVAVIYVGVIGPG
jgi:hypothetical protein